MTNRFFASVLFATSLFVGCERAIMMPTETVNASQIGTVIQVPPSRTPVEGQTRVLGTGWYANVEVDSQDRLHFAWVDADLGDVLYAVTDPGGVEAGPAQPVEVRGAVGSYLQLALGKGDTPVMIYYHQDSQSLRMAHKESDLALMKSAGAEVALAPSVPTTSAKNPAGSKADKKSSGQLSAKDPIKDDLRKDPTKRMGDGWIGETITIGDNVGMAAKLRIDQSGRPHLIYRTKKEKLHYARRPSQFPAFGQGTLGKFEISVVDTNAGASYTMTSDLLMLPDQSLVISYCHWNYVDSSLKLAHLPAGQDAFSVLKLPMSKQVDGWHSGLLQNQDGTIAVYSVATGDQKMYQFDFDLKKFEVPASRRVVMERPGASIIKRSADNTIWILTRGQGIESLGEKSGVWLIEIPQGEQSKIRRKMLEFGAASDPWIDLALRQDGRPVAVWTSPDQQSMRIYAP